MPAILEKPRQHDAEIAIASVVWHELRFGVERLPVSRRRELMERYLEDVVLMTMPILEYDRHAAECPRCFAGQIAAIAAVNDLVLVSRNVAGFKRFKDLRVRRWA